jgi:site-specific DNA-methyltransferase (adenine-specific)
MIHHGDCIPWLATLEPKSVDHCIMDPPYDQHVHAKVRAGSRPLLMGNGKPCFNREASLGFDAISPTEMDAVAHHVARVTRRWTMVFCNAELVSAWISALVRWGLEHVRVMAWVKFGSTPQFSGDRPSVGFESVVLAHPKGRKVWNGGGKAGVYSHPVVQKRGACVSTRHHTTQKPNGLMLDLVRDFTWPGDLILDPFTGSGTTGVAALRLGRRFLGCERDKVYHRTATERLQAEIEGSTLEARRAGQRPLWGSP